MLEHSFSKNYKQTFSLRKPQAKGLTTDLDLQCWWKSKKININSLIAKGGLSPFSTSPGYAFELFYFRSVYQTSSSSH